MGLNLFKSKKRSSTSRKSDPYAAEYGYQQQWQMAPPAYHYPQAHAQDVQYYPQQMGHQPRPQQVPGFSQPGTGTSYYTSMPNARQGQKSVSFAHSNRYC